MTDHKISRRGLLTVLGALSVSTALVPAQAHANFWSQQSPMQFAAERARGIRDVRARLTPIAERSKLPGERFEIIARPYQRRAIIRTQRYFGSRRIHRFEIRATNEQGRPLELTRIWATIDGRNRNVPSTPGRYGGREISFSSAGAVFSRLKTQTEGREPSIVYIRAIT